MSGEPVSRPGMYRRLRLVAVPLLLLGGLYAGLRLYGTDERDKAEPRALIFALTIAQPQPGAPLPSFVAIEGDHVTLAIQSQVAGEIHLHGYDRKLRLDPGTPTSLAVDAYYSGQFPIELHEADGSERQIAKLVVSPE